MKKIIISFIIILPSILFSQNIDIVEDVFFRQINSIYIDENTDKYIIISNIYTNKEIKEDVLNIHSNKIISFDDFSYYSKNKKFQYFLYSYYKFNMIGNNNGIESNFIKDDLKINCDIGNLSNFKKINFKKINKVVNFDCESNNLVKIDLVNKYKKTYNIVLNDNFSDIFLYDNCEIIIEQKFKTSIQGYYYNEKKNLLIFKLKDIYYFIN